MGEWLEDEDKRKNKEHILDCGLRLESKILRGTKGKGTLPIINEEIGTEVSFL